MRNVELDELQVGIKIGGRNVNNLRYSGMIPQEESETASLKLNIKKKKKIKQNKKLKKKQIMTPSPIISWEIQGGKLEIVTDFLFLGQKSM